MTPIKAIMIGAGQRGNAYAVHALSHPNELEFVGVAEPHEARRNQFLEKYNIDRANCLHTWEEVFSREKWADVVFICTPDDVHYEPVMAAIKQGYDVLLEKPISPSPKECKNVAAAAEAKGVKVVVCHVMRYTPFCVAIKNIINSGEIGKITTVVHNENVGNEHHSHSFTRGNWRNTKESSPMILQKSCHDMDMLQWLIGKNCLRLSSFGSLSYFNKDNCPANAPPRCTDGCPIDCEYDTRKLYMKGSEWFRSVAVGHANPTDDEVEAALKTGPYGRCVFQCDNDVVDHQVVSMEFEDGITAIFSMSSFTPETSRSIKIMGTKGQIKGHTAHDTIIVSNFLTGEDKDIDIKSSGGHGGGDSGIMRSFIDYIRGKEVADISHAQISAKNHLLCFAAEESRHNKGAVIEMEAYGE
ncbi:MAG: Gfo/Idh/MocA family oxidoreductase [Defluviitaleaceae bacterium]|nr:Gfo/Idh/MocA family oxidoreductase [Defluviitaleaceae bacterium]